MLHYEPNTIISKNRGLNIIIGARGFGKTFGFKKHTATRFIKTMNNAKPEQFMYVRVTKKQIEKIKDYWGTVGDVIENTTKLGKHTYDLRGDTCYIDNQPAGYLVALSDYLSYKGQEYPNVKYIIVDEFLDVEGWVRKVSPAEALLNLMDSVFRDREDTMAFCLSNAIKLTNLYFTYFGINVDILKEFNLYKDIAVQIIDKDSEEFVEKRKNTWFGRIIANTEYASVALDNKFSDDNDRLLRQKPSECILLGSIIYNNKEFGLWSLNSTGAIYITEYSPANPPTRIAISVEDLDDTSVYRKGVNGNVINKISIARNYGILFFDTISSRENGFDFLKKLGIY